MSTPGTLFAIGGAEDKSGPRTVLRRFVDAAGGANSTICVVPTASSLGPEVVDVYAALFRRLGAGMVTSVRPSSRADADEPAKADVIALATGIFLTGGNQLKLAQVINGTRTGTAIVDAFRNGAVVAGTSAGASIITEHMIAFGGAGVTPRMRASQLWEGLGLLTGAVIDQHFGERGRYGRLLSLVAGSPALLGIGIDENTAAVITPDHVLEVIGAGAVTIFDAHNAVSNAYLAERGEPLLVSGRHHPRPCRPAARFDLVGRALVGVHTQVPAREALEAIAAENDLRALARSIEAENDELTRSQEDPA